MPLSEGVHYYMNSGLMHRILSPDMEDLTETLWWPEQLSYAASNTGAHSTCCNHGHDESRNDCIHITPPCRVTVTAA